MLLTAEQLDKLAFWYENAKALASLKELESKLRTELIIELFNKDKDSGTESVEMPNGFQLKATKKLDYKLDNKQGQVEAVTAILEPELAKKLVKWKPELSVSAYKEIDPQTQKLFDGCLTIKPGMPSLEIVPPKGK